jgi:sugar transferase (PEP-CTERM/EpsH1 system associated)
MRILFLSAWFPYPPDNGSKIRVFNLLKELSKGHEITLLAFTRDPEAKKYIPALKEYCKNVRTVVARPFLPWELRSLLGFFSARPRSFVATYSHEMERLVEEETSSNDYDVLVASTLGTAEYALGVGGIPRVLEEHNLTSSIIWQKYRMAKGFMRLRYWLTWLKFRRFEARIIGQFDACTMVSEEDKEGVLRILPDYRRIEVIPNGVDLSLYRPTSSRRKPNSLIYTGALSYEANLNAMQFFLGAVYPLIRQECPDVTLKITGATEGVSLDGLPLDDSVTLTGYVDDIRPHLSSSSVCIVPLRIGGGTRVKVLEAMAMGTPVVATSLGARGIEVAHSENILVADDPEGFARCTLEVLRDTGLWEKLSTGGRRLVEEKYGWESIGRRFNDVLLTVAQSRLL